MAKLLISSIAEQSQQLGNLANQINNSGISKKDEWIDDKEFFKFQQEATALKNKGDITQKEFNAIFGLVMTDDTKIDSDMASYKKAMTNIEKTEAKQKKINELKNNIAKLREKLYKGKYKDIQERGYGPQAMALLFGGSALAATGLIEGFKLGATVGGPAGAFVGMAVGGFGGLAIGIFASVGVRKGVKALYGDDEFMRQCEKEDPTTYQALQYAERELVKLEK